MKPNPTIKNNLVIMQFQPSKSFKFLRRKFGAKVRSGHFGLSGVPNMIGFTTILAKTQPFVIHVWELNMKTNFCLARNFYKNFTYWKEAVAAFEKHRSRVSHRITHVITNNNPGRGWWPVESWISERGMV